MGRHSKCIEESHSLTTERFRCDKPGGFFYSCVISAELLHSAKGAISFCFLRLHDFLLGYAAPMMTAAQSPGRSGRSAAFGRFLRHPSC